MKIGEILRKIADAVDASSQPAQPEHEHDHEHSDLIPVPNDVFLPPLQGKYELLKKAVGVNNAFDENAGNVSDDPEASNHKVTPMSSEETDALERMKKAAGLNALIINDLSDDEPLEN